MKKIIIPILFFAVLAGLSTNSGCKKSTDITAYTLTVYVNTGVSGDPPAGEYVLNEGDEVTYGYSLESENYLDLKVTLDGTEIDPSGTVTMDDDHILVATANYGSGEYLLNVTVGTGATGTPDNGGYYYDIGDQVDYEYTTEDGYTNLTVLFDGVEIPSSGTLTISGAHTLIVYTQVEYDIRGNWVLQEVYNDESAFSVSLVFSGEIESGTVVDSHGGIGTYTVSGPDISFTLEFPDVTYEYEGTISDEENMSGDSKRWVSANDYYAGTWLAFIVDDSSSRTLSINSKKKGDK